MEKHEEGGTGSPHPERPDRVKAAIARVIAAGAAEKCTRIDVREASLEELGACHTSEHIRSVLSTSEKPCDFTSDTYSNPHTATAARLAAGCCIDVAVAVATGTAPCGAAICRPPGHHAESAMAMGFCFFNNAALAARAAQRAGARKVLIMDWDVHHGNGTQHIFEDDDTVMYMSIHRYDGGTFFPGTGAADEVGCGQGKGYTVNIPWDSCGATDGDYMAAFNQLVLPIAYEFSPDLIIVSAGFDAAKDDPIGGCLVSPEAFGHMAAMLKSVAPIAVLLEGGYNLNATAASVEQVLRVLLGERPGSFPRPPVMTYVGRFAIAVAQMIQSQYWSNLRSAKLFGAFSIATKRQLNYTSSISIHPKDLAVVEDGHFGSAEDLVDSEASHQNEPLLEPSGIDVDVDDLKGSEHLPPTDDPESQVPLCVDPRIAYAVRSRHDKPAPPLQCPESSSATAKKRCVNDVLGHSLLVGQAVMPSSRSKVFIGIGNSSPGSSIGRWQAMKSLHANAINSLIRKRKVEELFAAGSDRQENYNHED